jgi:integrase
VGAAALLLQGSCRSSRNVASLEGVLMPKTSGSGQARTLTPEQLDQLLDAAPAPEHRALWSIMRWTGSRVSETLALRWGAIHDDRIVFAAMTTKTKTTRQPLIAPRLQRELLDWRIEWAARYGRHPGPRDWLFPGRWMNEPMTRQWADRALRETLNGGQFPSGCSLHTFRRSLATTMANGGANLKTVCRFTGHRSLQQLASYIDVSSADERAALAALG